MKNGLGNLIVAFILSSALAANVFSQTVPADMPPDYMPLGVYLSWEIPYYCTEYQGDSNEPARWAYVGKLLDGCVQNNVNTLWVANMLKPHLKQLLAECEKRKIKLITSSGAIEGIYSRGNTGVWNDQIAATIESEIKDLRSIVGDSNYLAAWLIADEPFENNLPFIEKVREVFRRNDPNRPAVAVLRHQEAAGLLKQSQIPVICNDPYPFYMQGDPHGPHTDVTSKIFYRDSFTRMASAISNDVTVPWVMFQCFTEIWGPYKFNSQGQVIALPGAYMHWRAPTPAEMRWQVWEALRMGSKGLICYQLGTFMYPVKGMQEKEPHAKELLGQDISPAIAKEPTNLGFSGLTRPDATANPLFIELGRAYKSIAPHAEMIKRWKKSDSADIHASCPAVMQIFIDPADDAKYGIVVNDDLQEDHVFKLTFAPGVAKAANMLTGEDLNLKLDYAGGTKSTTVKLCSGDGVLLKLYYKQ
jgi:hypothetical protein